MIGLVLIFLGSAISLIGSLGMVRFPDIYTRTHAQTVINVGGTCLLLLGVYLQTPFLSLYSVKSVLLIIFVFLTSPVGSHAIARAAYKSGVKPKRLEEDELSYKIDAISKTPVKNKDYVKTKESKYKFKTIRKEAFLQNFKEKIERRRRSRLPAKVKR